VNGGLSRRELLAGAVAGGTVASGALAPAALAAGGGTAEIVSKILAAELLTVFCYGHVLELGILGAHATQVISRIRSHEQDHVRALEALLGQAPPVGPTTVEQADAELKTRRSSGRLTGLKSERAALDFLYSVESINIGAYDRALEQLRDPRLVRTSVEIMGAEAQHAAAIGALIHPGRYDRIVPVNFVKGKS
jgi:rubrerythrin